MLFKPHLIASHTAVRKQSSLYIQDVMTKVHRCMKVIVKKKRANAYVAQAQKRAVKNGQLRRCRRLRVVRRTRFNSRVACLDSYLLNLPLVRRLLTTEAFGGCLKVRNVRKKEHQENLLRTWQSETCYARARRALLLTGPASVLTRLAGSRDFFAVYPAWLRCKQEIQVAQDISSADNSKLVLFC